MAAISQTFRKSRKKRRND